MVELRNVDRTLDRFAASRRRSKIEAITGPVVVATGFEIADPWVDGERMDEALLADNLHANYDRRLDNIAGLGIRFVRIGHGYSQTHPKQGEFNFDLLDKLHEGCQKRGLVPIADLVHFGLPDRFRSDDSAKSFFQNPDYPEEVARFARAYADRYPHVRIFNIINEPFVTLKFSAKEGMWNEQIMSPGENDRAFVNGAGLVARADHLARAAILSARKDIDPNSATFFVRNDSFEGVWASPGSGRSKEARQVNIRRFLALDLMEGIYDEEMKTYAVSQGMGESIYMELVEMGQKEKENEEADGVVSWLGADLYRWNLQVLLANAKSVSYDFTRPDVNRAMYKVVRDYMDRYPDKPVAHWEANGPGEFGPRAIEDIYQVWCKLRADGMQAIAWVTNFGDEFQVGWGHGLRGPNRFEEYPVGLFNRGQKQPVADYLLGLPKRGFPDIPARG